MTTIITAKGQVTIPKAIRDALGLTPGTPVDFAVNKEGQIVIMKAQALPAKLPNRFEEARGKAVVKWRTQGLMSLLRDKD